MDSNTIRKQFIDFFKSKEHNYVLSSPIVSKNDPSLMFTNAGMNQFKSIFLGGKSNYGNRVVNSQKCLRVSGKHNDLEEVGIDHYHHTMFEMLGNWSFGDYFKEEIIKWSWEILTEIFKLPSEDLYVTVFEGSKEDNLKIDKEAFDIWSKIVDSSKIILGNKKDNFWEMGDSGPCGPCSEIHIDLRSEEEKRKVKAIDVVNKDHPQVIELWNLVFIQFNRKSNGKLEILPQKHIDTGMGFERLVRVIQNKKSNYDTDIFLPIINKIEKLSGKKYGTDEKSDIAFRVISDHLRAVSFCIADGQIPGNSGSSYVVRRILRRAIRYGYTFLNFSEPFIFKLVEVLTKQFKEIFPEIDKQKLNIKSIIEQEEKVFLKTLSHGISRLNNIIEKANSEIVSGKDVFELYDTYGFPADLTSLILSENKMKFNVNDFNKHLEQQKNRSRKSSITKTSDWNIIIDDKSSSFVGYDLISTTSKIKKFRTVETNNEKFIEIVFTETPFYPEGGGQVGDVGKIVSESGASVEVLNTKKENEEIIHVISDTTFEEKVNYKLLVDPQKRMNSSSNHTATHLLHQALRNILGLHVEQKGSLVNSDYLRFDFSYNKKLESNQILEVENFVNDRINESLELEENREESYDNAIKNGVVALFGEKYGDKVRSIKFGDSYELCGGTHVKNTLSLRVFKILSEGSVASGIRRIEAISGHTAIESLRKNSMELSKIGQLTSSKSNIFESVKSIQNEKKSLEKSTKNLENQILSNTFSELVSKIEKIGDVNFLVSKVDLSTSNMKSLCFSFNQKVENLFLVLISESSNISVVCYISKSLVGNKNLDASNVIKSICKEIDGAGGGQPFFAAGSGKSKVPIEKIIKVSKSFL
jgi:alanyl-tRNA synthetase